MNAFLYSMQLRGLKHGSEEEYDMFEDLAVCRARNRRTNGAAESRLQLQQVAEDHTTAHHAETARDQVDAEREEEAKCRGEDGNRGGEKARESAAHHPSTPGSDNKVLQIVIQVNTGVQQEAKSSKPSDPPQAKPDVSEELADSFQGATLGQHHI